MGALQKFIENELNEKDLKKFIQGSGQDHYFGTKGNPNSIFRIDKQGREYGTDPRYQNWAIQTNYGHRQSAGAGRSKGGNQGGGKRSPSMRVEAYVAIPVGFVPELDDFQDAMKASIAYPAPLKVVFKEDGNWSVGDAEEEEEEAEEDEDEEEEPKGKGKGKGKGKKDEEEDTKGKGKGKGKGKK